MTTPSLCLTCSPASAGSPLPPKSPTLWPTPNSQLIEAKDNIKLTGRTPQDPQVGLADVVIQQSPTPKSNPSPAPCITGTFPIQSALAESRMLHAMRCLSDAVSCRLSSPAGFLASRTLAPGSGLRVQMTETFGASVGECLATYDPGTHCLRMSQACLPLSGDDSSTESLATWPRCGMLVSGRLYQLPPLAHPTAENESGSSVEMKWPTPVKSDSNDRQKSENWHGGDLVSTVKEWSGPPSPATGPADPVKRSKDGSRQELWQTPRAEHDSGKHRGQEDTLHSQMKAAATGKLNPHWVATLMGYPPLWCELGEKFTTGSRNSKATATPSSRKSPQSCSTLSGGN